MRRWQVVRLARVALAAAAALACSPDEALLHAAPAQERAALVLEPPQVAVGDVADLVLSVVTHPGARVAPIDVPAAIPGFWLVEREAQAVVKEPARWLHPTRLRIRAVEVGRFEFPGGVVRAQSAEGASLEIPYAPLALEVVSSLAESPERRTPFGLRRLPAPRVGGAGAALAFGAGAALSLGAVGVVALARRRRAERTAPPPPAPAQVPAWEVARAALDSAQAQLAGDPREALDAVSRALRRYAAARYGADVPARSVEELSAAAPPFLMTTRWSGFVALLEALDATRFTPPRDDAARAARAAELLAGAREFVEDTTPQEARG